MIKQVQFSDSVKFFKEGFKERWKLNDYSRINEPAVFVGIYSTLDIAKIKLHKGNKIVFVLGADIPIMQYRYMAKKYMNNITAITVVHNTPELVLRAITSIKKHYPELPILIINGSNEDSECTHILNSINDDYITLVNVGYNIGHGKGMHLGLTTIDTELALIFDSDIYLKNGTIIEQMEGLIDGKYGVGEIVMTNDEGYNKPDGKIKYLHPYFMLLNVESYLKHPPFVHHGAPCYRAMNEINKSGCGQLLVHYENLSDYVRHDGRGTRNIFSKEFKLGWE